MTPGPRRSWATCSGAWGGSHEQPGRLSLGASMFQASESLGFPQACLVLSSRAARPAGAAVCLQVGEEPQVQGSRDVVLPLLTGPGPAWCTALGRSLLEWADPCPLALGESSASALTVSVSRQPSGGEQSKPAYGGAGGVLRGEERALLKSAKSPESTPVPTPSPAEAAELGPAGLKEDADAPPLEAASPPGHALPAETALSPEVEPPGGGSLSAAETESSDDGAREQTPKGLLMLVAADCPSLEVSEHTC